ncbi:MAG: hypothetical protein KBT05_05700 [Bacteroidales bacterium]|nr:hypothetical protein [Candidatus Cryptobacteroides caccocaballi]
MKSWQVKALKGLAWTAGVVFGLLVLVEVLLSPAVATRLVNKYAPEFIDADLVFDKAGISIFRNFPNISVRVHNAVLTYPHDRYARFENSSSAMLMREGRNAAADTLASFDRFTGAVSIPALLTKTIKVKKVELMHPRVFAKMYDDRNANWNILRSDGDAEEGKSGETEVIEVESESGNKLKIKLNKVRLADNAHIVFCMPSDTLYARLTLKEMSLRGRLALNDILSSRGNFDVDALDVTGRYKKDTLQFKLQSLGLKGSRKDFSLDANATAFAATDNFGRLRIPMSVDAKAGCPKDSIPVINIRRLNADVAGIPLNVKGQAILYSDRYYVDADVDMTPIRVGDLIKEYGPSFWTEAGKIESDARILFNADVDGYYVPATKEIPEIAATLSIPDSYVRYEGVDQALHLFMDAAARGGAGKAFNVCVDTLDVHTEGLLLAAAAEVKDLLGADPLIRLDSKLAVDVAKAIGVLPKDLGIEAEGDVNARINAKALLSQLTSMNRIGNSEILGELKSDCFVFSMPENQFSVDVDGLDINLGITGNRYDESMKDDDRVLMISSVADTLNADYKGMYIRAGKLVLNAQNSADLLSDMKFSFTENVRPFCGYNTIRSIRIKDADSTRINVKDLQDRFYIRPHAGDPNIPELYATSDVARASIRSSANRMTLSRLNVEATAVMRQNLRKSRAMARLDSMAKAHPEIPKDSIARQMRGNRRGEGRRRGELPEWLREDDFRAADLNLKLSGSIAEMFNQWDLGGHFSLDRATVTTPYLPLRNSISKAQASFTSDKVDLNSMVLRSGTSDISASGSLSNLRRALMGRGALNLDLRVTSDNLNANELLAALDAGSKVTEDDIKAASDLTDSDFEATVVHSDFADTTIQHKLIVIPANVNANVFLDANRILYSTIDFDWVQAELTMKERCLQLTNMIAMSNMGNVYCEAFYSTKTKDDIKAGVSIDLEDITAERVVELVPAVDSLIPMLKSFSGLLNCSVAVTTDLDDKMDILFPTLKGVVRISGSDLMVDDMGDLSRITRLLMFKNRNQLFVDHMSVDGLIGNNRVEIFPFVLDIDRYKLALAGIQNLDTSFKYHVSVMKSPLLFKFGIDLFGDFDKFKFRLGRAKYKREKRMPVFTSVVDESRANLKDVIKNIFKKSVERAIEEYNVQQRMEDYKEIVNYRPVDEMPLDSLSVKNAAIFDKMDAIGSVIDLDNPDFDNLDSLQIARLDSLGVSAADLRQLAVDFGDDEDEDEDDD